MGLLNIAHGVWAIWFGVVVGLGVFCYGPFEYSAWGMSYLVRGRAICLLAIWLE